MPTEQEFRTAAWEFGTLAGQARDFVTLLSGEEVSAFMQAPSIEMLVADAMSEGEQRGGSVARELDRLSGLANDRADQVAFFQQAVNEYNAHVALVEAGAAEWDRLPVNSVDSVADRPPRPSVQWAPPGVPVWVELETGPVGSGYGAHYLPWNPAWQLPSSNSVGRPPL